LRIRSGLAVGLVVASALVLVPGTADAAKFNVGAGVVLGTAQFASPGLAPAGQPCVPGSFTVTGTGAAAALNTVITGYVGTITLTGSGTTECGSTTASGGTLNVRVSGTGPTSSQIDCGPLIGTFTRAIVEVVVQVTGSCTINQYGTAPIQFVADLVFTPGTTTPGQGVTAPIMTAEFAGPFVLVPAAS
jgi:hypothetical protein